MLHEKKFLPVTVMLILLFLMSCGREIKEERVYPGLDWDKSSPHEEGFSEDKLVQSIKSYNNSTSDIHDVLIVKNGKIVFQAAKYPYPAGLPHALMSCTKSVTSALIGIAIDEKLIPSVDAPLSIWFPELSLDKQKSRLKLKHLLTMTAGLDWQENGSYNEKDSYIELLNHPDPINYFFSRQMTSEPGKIFYYNSGASFILGVVLEKSTGVSLLEYAQEKIFNPIGIKPYFWQKHRNGNFIGGSGLYLTAGDMARFGLLYARDGKWIDKQIIPVRWVKESTSLQADSPDGLGGKNGYGYQWWMNSTEGFSARGFGGQYILVVPEKDLVIVTTGGLFRYDYFSPDTILGKGVLESIGKPDSNGQAMADVAKLLNMPPSPVPTTVNPDKSFFGKRYLFSDGSALTLNDQSAENILNVVWEVGGEKLRLNIPLDGTYIAANLGKFGNLPENRAFFSGSWKNNQTLSLTMRGCGIPYLYQFKIYFSENTADWDSYVSYLPVAYEKIEGKVSRK